MVFTIDLSDDVELKLQEKAQAAGVDMRTYATRVLQAQVLRPSLEEELRPVRSAFHESGMGGEELGDLLEREKHDARAARRGKEISE